MLLFLCHQHLFNINTSADGFLTARLNVCFSCLQIIVAVIIVDGFSVCCQCSSCSLTGGGEEHRFPSCVPVWILSAVSQFIGPPCQLLANSDVFYMWTGEGGGPQQRHFNAQIMFHEVCAACVEPKYQPEMSGWSASRVSADQLVESSSCVLRCGLLGTPASNRKREEWNWNRSVQRRKGARLAMTERKGHYFSARGEKNAESKTWKWKLICGTCSAKAPHCTFKNVHLLTDQLSEFPEMCPTHKAMFRVMFLKRIFSLTQSGVEESFSTFTELQDLLSWRSSGAERQEKWKTIVKTLED